MMERFRQANSSSYTTDLPPKKEFKSETDWLVLISAFSENPFADPDRRTSVSLLGITIQQQQVQQQQEDGKPVYVISGIHDNIKSSNEKAKPRLSPSPPPDRIFEPSSRESEKRNSIRSPRLPPTNIATWTTREVMFLFTAFVVILLGLVIHSCSMISTSSTTVLPSHDAFCFVAKESTVVGPTSSQDELSTTTTTTLSTTTTTTLSSEQIHHSLQDKVRHVKNMGNRSNNDFYVSPEEDARTARAFMLDLGKIVTVVGDLRRNLWNTLSENVKKRSQVQLDCDHPTSHWLSYRCRTERRDNARKALVPLNRRTSYRTDNGGCSAPHLPRRDIVQNIWTKEGRTKLGQGLVVESCGIVTMEKESSQKDLVEDETSTTTTTMTTSVVVEPTITSNKSKWKRPRTFKDMVEVGFESHTINFQRTQQLIRERHQQ